MGKFILTIDQSTSSTKVFLVDKKGNIVDKLGLDHRQIYPQPGWLEHNPEEIYQNLLQLFHELVEKQQLKNGDVEAISITNQRETCLLWNQEGQPVQNAIVWQCNRTAPLCQQLIEAGHHDMIAEKTGLLINPYFSATKLQWLLQAYPSMQQPYFGTMDSWIIYNLTNKKVHATDYTNASRTLLFNIHTLDWDSELIALFNADNAKLPKILESDAAFGSTNDLRLPEALLAIPIYGVIGDSQGALFAQGCFKVGMAKATLGTGTSVLMNIGNSPIPVQNGLVTTVAWKLKSEINYALEGIIYSTGDTISWAKNNLGLFKNYKELMEILENTPSSEGVVIIPAFHGMGAPYWNSEAKAAIYGLSRSSSSAHIIRACIESIAHQIRDVTQLITKESALTIQALRCDGGATSNHFLIQDLANFLQLNIKTTDKMDLSPLGAAFICGLALGWWDLRTIENQLITYRSFNPTWDSQRAIQKKKQWDSIAQNLNLFY
ncbi:glycerol kinase GlpK [Metasolibacillus sp. FSL H7-0170]|uniref:FGGY family carbohydrate kinase n=1 Tax=Metasolibacillus TaxID=2703677 RepID=UPI000D3BFAE7|nr:glycerol kinase GlpK [Metasolibacillus fluoroglycofenilyticus]